jgi:hypothetical protein
MERKKAPEAEPSQGEVVGQTREALQVATQPEVRGRRLEDYSPEEKRILANSLLQMASLGWRLT